MRLLGQQERVHWTGLHRLLDSTTGMISMTRMRLLGQQERGSRERARETGPPRREEGWALEERGQRVLVGLQMLGIEPGLLGCYTGCRAGE